MLIPTGILATSVCEVEKKVSIKQSRWGTGTARLREQEEASSRVSAGPHLH